MTEALLGGALIGAAAVWLYLSLGRIAGISGIAAQAFRCVKPGQNRSVEAWGGLPVNEDSAAERSVRRSGLSGIAALIAGVVFGAGLVVSGMTNPDIVGSVSGVGHR